MQRYGVTWFSHIAQPWPATLEVKLSHVITRLAWSRVGYGEPGWFGGTLLCVKYKLSKCLFCLAGRGRNFVFLEIEENQDNQTAVSNEHPFSIAPRKQKILVILILGTSADIIMFSDIPIFLSTNQDFTQPSLCGTREIEGRWPDKPLKDSEWWRVCLSGTRLGCFQSFRDVWICLGSMPA